MARGIVLFDGLCGFCDGAVQWLLARDRAQALRFAPLQGETADAVRARHPELPPGTDSILYVVGEGAAERLLWSSGAALEICAALPAPWRHLRHLRAVPRPLRDVAYAVVARLRYHIAGRRAACRLPTPAERARFLP